MKIFGPVLGAILAAAAIIAVVGWFRTGILKHERVETALTEDTRRADAYLRTIKRAHGAPAARATTWRTPEPLLSVTEPERGCCGTITYR